MPWLAGLTRSSTGLRVGDTVIVAITSSRIQGRRWKNGLHSTRSSQHGKAFSYSVGPAHGSASLHLPRKTLCVCHVHPPPTKIWYHTCSRGWSHRLSYSVPRT